MQTMIYSNAELLILPKSAPEVLARQTASALVLSEYHVCSRCQPTTTVTTSSRECGALLNLACRDGFFVPPSLFKGVTREMSIAKEEIFGQAITGLKFESEEEAVAITNNSPYGLTSHIRNLYQGCGKKQ
jgi:hypothetical protein